MTTPTDDYLARAVARVNAAIARRDGDAVNAAINAVAADGHSDVAATLRDLLIEQGLDNLAARAVAS